MIYKFTIDTVVYPEDNNIRAWDTFSTTIKRNASGLKGLLSTQDVELVFEGDLYTYFYNKLYDDGVCAESDIIIHESCDNSVSYELFYTGKILVSDIKFDELHCLASSKIRDNSFVARIDNNKSIDTALIAARSKNDVAITACPIYDLIRFSVNNGNYNTSAPREAFRVYDVFKYLVAFMSDGEVGFESTYLGDTTDDPEMFGGLFISNGEALRTQFFGENALRLSFQKLYEEVSKLRKISFFIDNSGTTPILRIENEDFLFSDTNLLTFNDPYNVVTKTKNTELYSKVQLGSTTLADAVYLEFPEGIQFVGFKDETYHILGQCNIDNTLNLLGDFIRSSNVIEDCIEEANPVYDEDIFFIYCTNIDDVALTCDAKQKNWITGVIPPAYYNFELTNSEQAKGYLGAVPNSIATYLGGIATAFQANKLVNESYNETTIPIGGLNIEPFVYQNDSVLPAFDSGGNYSTVLSEYTVPVGGVYSFDLQSDYQIILNAGVQQFTVQYRIRRYDAAGVAGGNLLDESISPIFFRSGSGLYTDIHTGAFNCQATDVIAVHCRIVIIGTVGVNDHPTITFFTTSFFRTGSTITGGGVYQTYDPNDYKIVTYDFSYPIGAADFKTILANPTGLFTFTFKGVTRTGWLDQIKYNHKLATAEITLISSVNST